MGVDLMWMSFYAYSLLATVVGLDSLIDIGHTIIRMVSVLQIL